MRQLSEYATVDLDLSYTTTASSSTVTSVHVKSVLPVSTLSFHLHVQKTHRRW